MNFKDVPKFHMTDRTDILENLSKEYMKSIADYEKTKIDKRNMQPKSLEIEADDEMFSDCIDMS